MQCVILAGGLGTRMQPYTAQMPKTLIPAAGRPFAHYQLSWLMRHGITAVVYSIGHMGDAVREFVGDGSAWGLDAQFVEDGPQLVGTAGALRRALDDGKLAESFLVLYGDSFLPFDFRALAGRFQTDPRPGMLSVYRNEGRFDTGNVRFAGDTVQLYQKAKPGETLRDMPYIDYGVCALRREVVAELVPSGARMDLAEVYHRLSVDGRLAGFEVRERFYEIGSPQGLNDFTAWLAENPESTWPLP